MEKRRRRSTIEKRTRELIRSVFMLPCIFDISNSILLSFCSITLSFSASKRMISDNWWSLSAVWWSFCIISLSFCDLLIFLLHNFIFLCQHVDDFWWSFCSITFLYPNYSIFANWWSLSAKRSALKESRILGIHLFLIISSSLFSTIFPICVEYSWDCICQFSIVYWVHWVSNLKYKRREKILAQEKHYNFAELNQYWFFIIFCCAL